MEPKTDPVDHRETEFVKSLAQMLDREQQKGAFDRLVIAASPIALGDIRKAISPSGEEDNPCRTRQGPDQSADADKLDRHLDGILAV